MSEVTNSVNSSIISSLGAGSGLNSTTLVSQLVALERAPLDAKLDERKAQLDAQISGYGKLKSALGTFQTAVSKLASEDLFNARTTALPETDVITATALKAGGAVGSFSVEVTGVASAHTLAIGGKIQSDPKAALGASGAMTIQLGTWTGDAFAVNDERSALTIDVENTDSLQDIAAKINAGNSGVQAAVIKVSGAEYQLTLTSASGSDNAMEISVSDASLDAFSYKKDAFNATQTLAAQDAKLKVNGVEVTRSSNNITDVIEGFEFTLNKTNIGSPVNFTINADKDQAEQAVRDLVTAYNTFYETTNTLVGYSRNEDNELIRGDLAGDSTARSIVNRLREALGGSVAGLSSATGFNALTNLGIRTELNGKLSINETEFKDAINNKFDLVGELFVSKTTSSSSLLEVNLGTMASRAKAGTYTVNTTQDATRGQLAAKNAFVVGPLNIADTDNSYNFQIKVDSVASNTIVLNGEHQDAEAVRSKLQTLINGDSNLKAANVSLDVEIEDGKFVFKSREYGAASQVRMLDASANMNTALGIYAGGTFTPDPGNNLLTDGLDVVGTVNGVAGFGAGNVLLPALDTDAYGLNFTVSAGAVTRGQLNTNALGHNFGGGALTIGSDHTFKIGLNGVTSGTITLTAGDYASGDALASTLQTLVNDDSALKAAGASLRVSYDSTNNRLSFTSDKYGAGSQVRMLEPSVNMQTLGFADTNAYTDGADVTVNYSRGFAGELNSLIDSLTGSSGTISEREKSIQNQLDDVKDDRTALDRKMDSVNSRMMAQFMAMERIVSSLKTTGGQLDGLTDRLPFTAG